jgi:hypothetical protein
MGCSVIEVSSFKETEQSSTSLFSPEDGKRSNLRNFVSYYLEIRMMGKVQKLSDSERIEVFMQKIGRICSAFHSVESVGQGQR